MTLQTADYHFFTNESYNRHSFVNNDIPTFKFLKRTAKYSSALVELISKRVNILLLLLFDHNTEDLFF